MDILAFASFLVLVVAWMVAPASPTLAKVATEPEAKAA